MKDEETIHKLSQKLQKLMNGKNQILSPSSNKSFKSSDFENFKIINREQSKTISDLK